MSHPHHPHKPGDKAGHRKLDDGAEDRLVPLKSIDPLEIRTFDDMVTAMSKTAFSGRSLGEACDVLTAMTSDPDCLIVATFSGAMTVAKMGMVLIRMIEAGMIHCVVSTGALMAHGLSEAVGLTHYKVNPTVRRTRCSSRRATTASTTRSSSRRTSTASTSSSREVLDTLELDPSALVERDHLPRTSARPSPRWATPPASCAGVPAQRARLRPRLHRQRDGPRRRHVDAPSPAQGARNEAGLRASRTRHAAAVQPLPRPAQLRALVVDQEEARHLHHRRRRAAQLGPAGGPVLRHRRSTASASSCPPALLSTACASAPSPCTGAASPAAPTPRA
jgi:hypothetical protein